MNRSGSSPDVTRELVHRVCRRVPPSFRLADFVAVSPFVGYAEMPFLEAHAALERRLHADLLPEMETFRGLYQSGGFDAADLFAAAEDWERSRAGDKSAPKVDALLVLRWLDGTVAAHPFAPPAQRAEVLSIAERIDRAEGTALRRTIVESIARLCAELHDRGVARIGSPLRGLGLYEAFLLAAPHDPSLDTHGLSAWREIVAELPSDTDAALERLLCTMDLGNVPLEDYLGRLLAELKGWAGALRAENFSRDATDVGRLPELLLVRLILDVALTRAELPAGRAVPRVPRMASGPRDHRPRLDVVVRYLLLAAAERGFHRGLVAKLAPASSVELALVERERPAVQAVFCIDVRSEPLRRALESATSSIETYGFAGFFGMPIAIETSSRHDPQPQCPALIEPTITLRSEAGATETRRWPRLASVLDDLRNASFGSFSYVETLGFGAVSAIARETLGLARSPRVAAESEPIDHRALGEQTGLELATAALRNLGLRPPYARLLLLVGHDATSANDPLRAGLSCGACSGHGGAPNARLLARLLNDRTLRAHLAERGFAIPDDCHVSAALHDTTTDIVRLLDLDAVPATHRDDVRVLEAVLQAATREARAHRARSLPGLEASKSAATLARRLEARAHDWSEVRPEWALAGNAAFVAARRERTRGADLEGRVFLNSYDRTMDPDGSVLRLLLNAPVVVASFINLQYYGSTVAKEQLGSGNKTIHNVSGTVGVALGNGGDLAVGLSLQSVSDGDRDRHQPLRLQVFVEDTPERITRVLDESPTLAAMVANEYLLLFSLDPAGERVERVRFGSVGEPRDVEVAPSLGAGA